MRRIVQQLAFVAAAFLLGAVTTPATAQRIFYVDDDGPPLGDGMSWSTAYRFLQDALADAGLVGESVEIRVAQGTYRPDWSKACPHGTGNRLATFRLTGNIAICGGYAGCGAVEPNVRDTTTLATVLSGDLADDDVDVDQAIDLLDEASRFENCQHVVTVSYAEPNSVLDGLTITGGYERPVYSREDAWGPVGGGLYAEHSKVTVRDCRFVANMAGGGGAVRTDHCQVTVADCIFERNLAVPAYDLSRPNVRIAAYGGGGAMLNYSSSVQLCTCTFKANTAGGAGAVSTAQGALFAEDCSFLYNSAGFEPGAVFNGHCVVDIARCIFVGNSADSTGAMMNISVTASTLTNCIFAGTRGCAVSNLGSTLTIANCTIVDNRGSGVGSGGDSRVTLANCIIRGDRYDGPRLGSSKGSQVYVTHCNLEGGRGGVARDTHDPHTLQWGPGNIDVAPLFAAPGYWDPNGTWEKDDDFFVLGDYHLKSQTGRWDPNSANWVADDVTSPCIDAGDPDSPVGDEPAPNGGIINMGAYGGAAEASKSGSDVGTALD